MKERFFRSIFGEPGEVSNRRGISLFLEGMTLGLRHSFDLDRQNRENFRIRSELLDKAARIEMYELRRKLQNK